MSEKKTSRPGSPADDLETALAQQLRALEAAETPETLLALARELQGLLRERHNTGTD